MRSMRSMRAHVSPHPRYQAHREALGTVTDYTLGDRVRADRVTDHLHRAEPVPAAHFGRDMFGRLMACTLPARHPFRRCVSATGATLRRER